VLKVYESLKKVHGPLKNSEGETVTNSQGMAELLNTCFKEVFTKEMQRRRRSRITLRQTQS
jgi:hypothetical protein